MCPLLSYLSLGFIFPFFYGGVEIPLSLKEVAGTKDVSQDTINSGLAEKDFVSPASYGDSESSAIQSSAKREHSEYSTTSTVTQGRFFRIWIVYMVMVGTVIFCVDFIWCT